MSKSRASVVCLFTQTALCMSSILCTAAEEHWIGSWYAAPVELAPHFSNATLRTVVHVTAGGDRLRLRISNLYGRTALKVGAVYVAVSTVGRQATFSGQPEIVLSPGAVAVSDPVDLKTSAGAELAVSVFYPEAIPDRKSVV